MSKPVRALLIGSAGRMGQTIVDLAKRDDKIDIVALCDQGDAIEPKMADVDVAIDFSHADAIADICAAALKKKTALVIGTTAHSAEQKKTIATTAQSVPIVFASNFSVGVNTLFALARKTAAMLGDEFKIDIVETHHAKKKDAPSGTAKTLAEILKKARESDAEIPIESIREGEVIGNHSVSFADTNETLELTHRANSREIFAKGALRAVEWVVGKPPGLYSMEDVLGLSSMK